MDTWLFECRLESKVYDHDIETAGDSGMSSRTYIDHRGRGASDTINGEGPEIYYWRGDQESRQRLPRNRGECITEDQSVLLYIHCEWVISIIYYISVHIFAEIIYRSYFRSGTPNVDELKGRIKALEKGIQFAIGVDARGALADIRTCSLDSNILSCWLLAYRPTTTIGNRQQALGKLEPSGKQLVR